jgi:hypothetical protein
MRVGIEVLNPAGVKTAASPNDRVDFISLAE